MKKLTTKESILKRLTRDEIFHVAAWLRYFAEQTDVPEFAAQAREEANIYQEALDWIDDVATNDPNVKWNW